MGDNFNDIKELNAKLNESIRKLKTTGIAEDIKELKRKIDEAVREKSIGSFWTRTRTFKKLCKWAFKTCNNPCQKEEKRLTKSELYSSLLLVYLNIAKYAGPAACYPPSREAFSTLFDACDVDKSGDICEEEFTTIMIILTSQMTWRIFIFYALAILMVPQISIWIVNAFAFLEFEMAWLYKLPLAETLFSPESIVSCIMVSFVIPYVWMDSLFQKKP